MKYGNNILKKDPAFYELYKASISYGTLNIKPDGYATQHLYIADIASLTSWFKFTCILDTYANHYTPDIQIIVHAQNKQEQKYYNVYLYPVNVVGNLYECEFEFLSGDYDDFYVTIKAKHEINMTFWELCPEAANENVETVIEGVKQSLPKLLYDYNTSKLEVTIYEEAVAVITCRLLQATDIQGHFNITFFSTANSTVILRFYDNEAEELFSPLYYDAHIGNNTIGVPHAYLKRVAGIHTFVVTMQINTGLVTIDVRKVLFTIDGGYLAIRALDIAMDVTDIAIRQTVYDNGPDEIWAVGLDKDILLVRKRKYKETNANVKWDAVGSLGKSLGAAIEFNGRWVLRSGAGQYTINTDEVPFIFNINENNELYVYHGVEDEEPLKLVEDVLLVKACRGFASIDYPEQDQGLTIAFIKKDKSAWYKQFVWNADNEYYHWLVEERIGTELWDFINVSRLNDYRLMFQLSNQEKNLWLYTEQTWVGQATPPETWDAFCYSDQYAMWCGGSELDRKVSVDKMQTSSVYNKETKKYDWTVIFHINKKIIVRSIGDMLAYVQVTDDLQKYFKEKQWNPELNTISIILEMTETPEEVYKVFGTFRLSCYDGLAVIETENGYHLIETVEKYWEVENIPKPKFYSNTNTESLILGVDLTKNALGYQLKQYIKKQAPAETFTLGTGTHTFSCEAKVYVQNQAPIEEFTLGTDITYNLLSYAGTSILPI